MTIYYFKFQDFHGRGGGFVENNMNVYTTLTANRLKLNKNVTYLWL